ncbi:hypothetical protein K491DRAFT_217121 [Lophiostoma macrostomum CBS 122681]|uniref:Uncharacterized protein n=1 Tax=Lophiostoma macrostomum CBS 122681 TaxID=1314788 RepID=A0A6A6TGS0_9PLEO|nr:hypothetical protein K491DRAFT_217121 [Lophiostoma macrostomum CBS 122681]
MADKSPSTIVGCLLDVSGSMREALEAGHGDNRTVDRFHAILSAALKLAKAEQRRDSNALMFVGAFGLREEKPPVVDLCQLIEALVADEVSDETGYDLLIRLANERNQHHITKYIRTKFTENEARMLYVHLQRHSERLEEFVRAIPPPEKMEKLRTGSKVAGAAIGAVAGSVLAPVTFGLSIPIAATLGGTVGSSIGTAIEEDEVDKSEALGLARRICKEWMQDFKELLPRRISDVVDLLEKLQSSQIPRNHNPEAESNTLLDRLRQYVSHRNAENRVLVLLSDGLSTDGDPLPTARELQQEKVVIATVYLTKDQAAARRRIHDQAARDWNDGQKTLYEMAERVSCLTHPIPVLATLGWSIPSSGEGALHASVCSTAALDEFCSMLLSARFGSSDALLDIAGRVRLDKYINDEHVRNCKNPSDQGQSATCYAHAAAFVLHSALRRIVGRTGGHPSIEAIRNRILQSFPNRERGHSVERVLEEAIKWYPPICFRKVDEDGARQAVLRRRPVLTTFHLSNPGWNAFCRHFEEEAPTRTSLLTSEKMRPHRDLPDDGGHAVALVKCDPHSLTFLNSWGEHWGNGGSFSIQDPTVLQLNSAPASSDVCFYDVYWLESGLSSEERRAYDRQVDEELRARAEEYPSILDLEYRCPLCLTSSAIAKFKGNVYHAVCPCPDCGKTFEPEPGHLMEALYARAGLSSVV